MIDYSYRLSHDHRLRLLVVLDGQMICHGLATAERAILGLDFHAIMRWDATRPGEALRALTRFPTSPLHADLHPQDNSTHHLVHAHADIAKGRGLTRHNGSR